jgi:uncharacterized membrane protein
MKKNVSFIIVLLIALIPLIYLATLFSSLPARVPTHFSIDGTPDDYSKKVNLFFLVGFVSLINLGTYLLLTNIQKIDPKKAANQSKETMQKIGFAITLLLTGINIIVVNSAKNSKFSLNVLIPVIGLFFAYLGNLIISIKPNYFVGIRTPWTIEDEETWRKTHQLAGKMWFAGGLLITIFSLVTPVRFAVIILLCILTVVTVVPMVYSYRYFRAHKK